MKFKDALQNHFKKGRLMTLRWSKSTKINKLKILRLSEAIKSEVMLAYKCNPLIVKEFLFRVK